MRKVVIIGCFIAGFLLLMIPNISAVEYNTIVDVNKNEIIQRTRAELLNLKQSIESIKNMTISLLKLLGILVNIAGIIFNIWVIYTGQSEHVLLHLGFLLYHILLLIITIIS
jgi:hypothetical protein